MLSSTRLIYQPPAGPTWPTARDIAGLPGMPGTVRGIHKRAEVQGWPSTTEPVRGGLQVRYDPTVLPAEARLALAARITTMVDGNEQEQHSTVSAQLLQRTSLIIEAPARQLSQTDANRTRVLVLFQRFWTAIGGSLHPALQQFALLWSTGRIDAPEALRLAVPTLSTPTLRRWWLALEEQGTLARKPHPKRGQFAALSGEVGTAVLAILATKPHLSATAVRSLLLKHGAVPADQVPSERAVQRAIKAFKSDNAQGWLAHTNPDAWRSKYLSASGDAAAHITRPNEEWQMDSTVGDCMLTDPETGEIRRHHIIAVIDVFTRRCMFLVTRTSKANAIASLIRKAINAWGKPERIKTDNGSDYVADLLDFALIQLGIQHPLCEPFQPQQKPFVERVFGTLLHSLFPLLNGFIGHSVVQRKAIESAKSFAHRLFGKDAIGQSVEMRLTPAQLQAMIDTWVSDYLDAKHGTLGCSPNQQTQAHLREIHRIDTRALDLFLAPVAVNKTSTIGKKGIVIDKGIYTAPELGGLEGKQVRCRIAEDELGEVYVYDLDGAFICIATDTSRLGISLQEVSAKRKGHQQKVVAEFKAAIKTASRAYDTDAAVREVYLDRQATAIDQSEGKVKRLPPRETLASTPAIDSALNGLQHRGKAPQVPEHQRQAVQAAMARLEAANADAPVAQVFKVANTPNARYSTWLRMQARTEQGQALSPAEKTWFTTYGTAAEWRTMNRLHEGTDPLAANSGHNGGQ
jgi:putative transposase